MVYISVAVECLDTKNNNKKTKDNKKEAVGIDIKYKAFFSK
ncbi:hypothetical protein BSPA14S_H0005 (plasmid) [Borreliella spielmanii A14S]|uniref:Uncharacterized protein n=1 Tax=Borreliella spielmanii A14S TaxID=498742 RepID=C0RCD1_9SPIR|nr:hypothetical protein BSPA14S_H0005 [Borreliella spielmanii A14S]